MLPTPFPGVAMPGQSTEMVAVLFARHRSVYKSLPACDVWDEARDARNYAGEWPVIAHPPCRSWGRLRGMAKPRPGESELALFAVDAVRRCGGVLEHPSASQLWPLAGLPALGARDGFGGFTLPILQSWFGHRAPKSTWLYCVGVSPALVPPLPFQLGIPPGRIEAMCRAERERTPVELALWLVSLARLIGESR